MTDLFNSISIIFLAIATVVNTVNLMMLSKSTKRLREQDAIRSHGRGLRPHPDEFLVEWNPDPEQMREFRDSLRKLARTPPLQPYKSSPTSDGAVPFAAPESPAASARQSSDPAVGDSESAAPEDYTPSVERPSEGGDEREASSRYRPPFVPPHTPKSIADQVFGDLPPRGRFP